MKPQNFAILLVVAVLSLAVALTAYVTHRPWTSASGIAEAMLPSLKPNEGKVAAIEINQGGKIVKITDKNGKWVIATQEDYPANTEAVRKLLLAASDAKLVERKTAKKDKLGLLGLSDPTVAGASSRLIRFLNDKGSPIGEIVAGNKKSDAFGVNKNGTYVRRPDKDQAWLADRSIDATADIKVWANARVVDVPTTTIKNVTVEVAGDPAYTIERQKNDHNNFQLSQMPAGKKLKYVNSVDEIVESVSYVDFQNVRKATAASGTMQDKGKATFETDDGLKVELDLKSDGTHAWVTVKPSGTGDDGKKAAEAMSQLVNGWEFEIPPAKVTSLTKKQADLLEDTGS
jgi:hypothetical protein